jgi:coenzyme F420 hydrogenase subunit beta
LELTLLGLLCFEAFNYEKLKEAIKRLLAIDLDRADKTQIRKGIFTIWVDGKENSLKVKELSAAAEKGCLNCSDFTARDADVSVGSVGSDEGYSTVVVRTAVGRKLIENLDVTRGVVRREEIIKVATFKRKRATNE